MNDATTALNRQPNHSDQYDLGSYCVTDATGQTRHSRLYPANIKAGTQFSEPGWMQGWVDLVGLHTKVMYPPEDCHPSQYWPGLTYVYTRSIWKMLGPFATASRRTPIQQVSLPVLSRAACASMSTTTDNDNAWQRGPLWPHEMGPIRVTLLMRSTTLPLRQTTNQAAVSLIVQFSASPLLLVKYKVKWCPSSEFSLPQKTVEPIYHRHYHRFITMRAA